MCTTCDHKNFDKVSIENNGRVIEKLERSMGYGSLVMRCDLDGTNRVLAVKGEPKSDVRIYRCPTCGQLFLD
jgi:hypothetical protein